VKKKEAKKLLGMNNKELAEALNISESYIRNNAELSEPASSHVRALVVIADLKGDVKKSEEAIKEINNILRALDI